VSPLIGSWTLPSTFGRNHQTLGVREQRFRDQLFIHIRPIVISGVDEIDT